MFERFTNNARQTVVAAQEEARLLRHNYIGTEHVLLGLLRDGQGMAYQVLRQFGLNTDGIRTDVVGIVGEGKEAPGGHIPFTPRAKKVLELSLREALRLKHNYIGTEHILLGLIREGQGVGAQVLVGRGVTLEQLRAAVMAEAQRQGGAGRDASPALPARTPATEQVFAIAAQLAGSAPLGTHHLLEALARADSSLAAHALTAVGVDVEVLAAKIDELGPEGTADLTPEQEIARAMEIRLDGEEVHVVLRDSATVELAREITDQLGGSAIKGDDPLTGSLIGLHQAVIRSLQEVRRRVLPPAEEESGPRSGISHLVHRAFQSRLRRRAG
jgi:ATP-dependent Clp protease ATP-binding subunit ClpC